MNHSQKKKMIPLQELTLMHRFLFSEAVEDQQFFEDVLSIIMGEDILLNGPPQAEKEVRTTNEWRKYVRLDVWAKDDQDRIYLNTKGTDPENISQELRTLLEFFENPSEEVAAQSESYRIKRLQQRVQSLKKNADVGARYMRAWEEIEFERQKAVERVNALHRRLLEEERFDDLKRCTEDLEFQEDLMEEYDL